MNLAGGTLSEGCIKELYTTNRCEAKQPAVQIIDFQQSEINEKEIIIRISDGCNFVDCTLSGNYQIVRNSICQTKNATTLTNFKRMHIVRLADYFSKLDETRICKLKVIIRKMIEVSHVQDFIGNPQEIQQFLLSQRRHTTRIQHDNISKHNQDHTVRKAPYRDQEIHSGKSQETSIKIENVYEVENSSSYIVHNQSVIQANQSQSQANLTATTGSAVKLKKEIANIPAESQSHGLGEPLSLQQILSGKQGFLIGRLVRFKTTRKQTKDGPIMTVCYLGILDKNDEMVRIHLAGRLAMNNEKTLKKNKCYYIRGFDLVTTKNKQIQIRLKDKQYKILEIYNEDYIRNLKTEYFHWDHDRQVENEFIDVIGVVDDIEDKTTYNPNNLSDTKSVIRVVLRNKRKSVRISFWSDQMKTLETLNLKKKECIIFQDVRKKQSKYYDYGFQSNFIRLSEHPFLMQKFQELLPNTVEEVEPQNIRELSSLYQQQPNNNKLRSITAYFTHCHETNIVYRSCDECKKKVERNALECQECGSDNLVFKYNCRLEFSDCTGSIIAILFEVAAYKLIGKTANEMSQLSDEQVVTVLEGHYYRLFLLSVQYRNQRIIIRSIDPVTQNQETHQIKENISKIKEEMYPSELLSYTGKL